MFALQLRQRNIIRILVVVALNSLLSLVATGFGAADDYPTKPITLNVGFAPGSSSGNAAHIFAEGAKKYLPNPQPIIVNFKPGASSAVAADFVLKQPPDGYNLLLLSPDLSGKLAKDGHLVSFKLDDFLPIGMMGASPHFLAVNREKSPFMKLEDFLDHAKKHPGELSYGSSGIGSSNYFTTYLFMAKCGIKMNHVPFPGAGQTMTALMGGHIDCFISTPGTAAAHIKPGGELRVLTFFTQKRWPELPDVPTFLEKGYDLERTFWCSVFAPKGTPQPVMDTLIKAFKKTADDPQVKAALLKVGFMPLNLGPEETGKKAKEEFDVLKEIYKKLGPQ